MADIHEDYREKLALEFERRNQLLRFTGWDDENSKPVDTAPNGMAYEEVFVTKATTRDECVQRLGIILDGCADKRLVEGGGDAIYWYTFPEVSQSEARPGLWRGYACLCIGKWAPYKKDTWPPEAIWAEKIKGKRVVAYA